MNQGQVNFATSPLYVNGRQLKGASFGRTPLETLSTSVYRQTWHPESEYFATSDLSSCCQGHFRSWKVTSSFSSINFDRNRLERWKYHRCVEANDIHRSTDMQHDLFGPGHDLDLWSNFPDDLLRSKYNAFDASRQEKHDVCKTNAVPLLNQKILSKNVFLNGYCLVFAHWRPNLSFRSNPRTP